MADVLESHILGSPGIEAWVIEGLDMTVKNVNDLEQVSELMESLRTVAARHRVAVVGTLGSAKQKQGEASFNTGIRFMEASPSGARPSRGYAGPSRSSQPQLGEEMHSPR